MKKIIALAFLACILLFFGIVYATPSETQVARLSSGQALALPGYEGQYLFVYHAQRGSPLNSYITEAAVLTDYAMLKDGDMFHSYRITLGWEDGGLKEIRAEGATPSSSQAAFNVNDASPFNDNKMQFTEADYGARIVFTPAIEAPDAGSVRIDNCGKPRAMRLLIKFLGEDFVIINISANSSNPYIIIAKEKSYGIYYLGNNVSQKDPLITLDMFGACPLSNENTFGAPTFNIEVPAQAVISSSAPSVAPSAAQNASPSVTTEKKNQTQEPQNQTLGVKKEEPNKVPDFFGWFNQLIRKIFGW